MADKCILITGGYGKLGVEFANAFTDNGDQVVITGRNSQKLSATARQINCDSFIHDVTDEENTQELEDYLRKKYNKLDVLINNAGLVQSQPVEIMEPKLFFDVVNVNLYGTFLCTHKLLPLIKLSGDGLIINVASTSGHRADSGSSAYNASKFGVLGFTEALRKEVRKFNIRVTSISPSSICFGDAPDSGKGVGLNGKDIADTAVFLTENRGRALFRDLEIWGTNP